MTGTPAIFRLTSKALGLLGAQPADLQKALSAAADYEDEPELTPTDLADHLEEAPVDDSTRLTLHQRLAQWDAAPSPAWGGETAAQTPERRARIYELLELDNGVIASFDRHFPPHIADYPNSLSHANLSAGSTQKNRKLRAFTGLGTGTILPRSSAGHPKALQASLALARASLNVLPGPRGPTSTRLAVSWLDSFKVERRPASPESSLAR